ncbi:polysaccharide deacetylase family protein [Maribacter aestuarii]|uniref:polysaccharide deacetylase family protein n=1 Tax=Maribacter aestuarii TaxID=1130723 RepID=UPI00248B7E6F|nr:polysaccharide deacetylase family protein [Maribacter aestuarii]
MKQLFERTLGVEIGYATKVEDFIKHSGPKMTYTKQPLQNEFFVKSNDLLFEQGINDVPISVMDWDDTPCFFGTDERSNVPFDVFAASFYLLSRYEEYLPHVKDIHGRFSPKDSLAYQNNFLHKPVVDIWAFKLLAQLQERFPELEGGKRNYEYVSLLDVTTSHCYSHRGVVRGISGLALDLGTLKLRRVIERLAVWLKLRKDPYDNFSELINWHREYGVKSIFFFQFADYSKYDKNVSINNNNFKSLIKYIADYSTVALAASYTSFNNEEVLKKEKNNLEGVINRAVTSSRMRYNRVDVPDTYRRLLAAEFTDDYTMGYSHEIGFRAGTCTSFAFYDIPLEIQQPIKVHPYAVHDYALSTLKREGEVSLRLNLVYDEVKNVNGGFRTVFSNELLGSSERLEWKTIYKAVLNNYHV